MTTDYIAEPSFYWHCVLSSEGGTLLVISEGEIARFHINADDHPYEVARRWALQRIIDREP
jgi:hypothetical protein